MLESISRIIALIIKEILIITKDKKSRIIIIFPPIMQVLMFTYVATLDVYNSKIGILNKDNGIYSREIINNIVPVKKYFKKIYHIKSENEAKQLLDEQKVNIILEFDDKFSKNIESNKSGDISIITDGRSMNSATILSSYIQSIISQGLNNKIVFRGKKNEIRSNVLTKHAFNIVLNFRWFIMPALLGLLLSSSLIALASLSIAREKEMGTFDQLIVSPLNSFEIVIGKAVSCLLVALIQAIILFIAIKCIGIPYTSKYIYLVIGVIFYSFAIIGIGISISTACVTQQQAILGVFAVSIPLMMLSGFASSVQNMPILFQYVSFLLNPVYHFICISRLLFLKYASIYDIYRHLLMLFIIMFIAMYVSIIFFKRKMP